MSLNLNDLTKDPKKFEKEEVKGDIGINIEEEAAPSLKTRAEKKYEEHLEKKQRASVDNRDDVFKGLLEDSQMTMKSNGTFMAVVPILSGVIAPAVLMFTVGLDDAQLLIMKAVLIANIIAMVLTAIAGNINLWDAIKKTNRNAYRAAKAKYELQIEQKNSEINVLKTENKNYKNTLLDFNDKMEEQEEKMEELKEFKYKYELDQAVKAEVKVATRQ